MTTVNSHSPANLFVATPSLSVNTFEGGKFDLNPGQMLRAIVISRELDQVVLEIDRQLYLAKGERELQVGQKVDLQVVQTQPNLEFKVLTNPLNGRLNQSLPLLTRTFDWSQLIAQLQKPLGLGLESAVPVKIYSQLQQILGSTPGTSVQLDAQIANIVTQLQGLAASGKTTLDNNILSPPQIIPQLGIQNLQSPAPSQLSQTVMRLIKNLQNQLSLLPKEGEALLPKSWHAETRSLLAPLQQSPQLPLPLASQRQLLVTILRQIQQHPKVSPQLSAEVRRVLTEIDRQVTQDFSMSGKKAESVIVGGSAAMSKQPFANSADNLAKLSIEIRQLLPQAQQELQQRQSLSPELLGRLEGLLSRLQQLPQTSSVSPPDFDVMVNQLKQLVTQQQNLSRGGCPDR